MSEFTINVKPQSQWQDLMTTTNCQFADCGKAFKKFSLSKQKAHCHGCGIVCCLECAAQKTPLPPTWPEPVSVCERCYAIVQKRLSVFAHMKNAASATGKEHQIGIDALIPPSDNKAEAESAHHPLKSNLSATLFKEEDEAIAKLVAISRANREHFEAIVQERDALQKTVQAQQDELMEKQKEIDLLRNELAATKQQHQ